MEPVRIGFSPRKVAMTLAPYAVGALAAGYVGTSWLLEEPMAPIWRICLAFCACAGAIYLSEWFVKSTCPVKIDAADVFVALTLGLPVVCTAIADDLVAAFGILCLMAAGLALTHIALTLWLVLSGPALLLDERGITHRASTFGFGFIPWEDVFEAKSVSPQSMTIVLDDVRPYIDRVRGSRRLHVVLMSDVAYRGDSLTLEWPLSDADKSHEEAILDFLTP